MLQNSQILFLAVLLAILAPFDSGHASKPSTTRPGINTPDNSIHLQDTRLDSDGFPRAMYNVASRRFGGTPEQAARAFLHEQFPVLGLESSTTQITTDRVNRVPGGSHVRFTQTLDGIPVYRGDVVVSMNDNNEIGMVINNARADIDVTITQPAFGGSDAIVHARNALQVRGRSLGKDDEATLMIYQSGTGAWHLAYRVTMTNEDPYGDWEVFVDALSGEMLDIRDIFVRNSGTTQGSGYVFLPDPLSSARKMYNAPGFVDGNDADTDSLTFYRTLVVLDSITHEDGVYKLKGPFCNVTDIEPPTDPLYYSATTPDGFTYTRSQQEFEAVMVYYHISTAYQHLRKLGFEIPSLRGIRVDPHGYYGQDNSHYSPSGNWISFGEGGVDDAEDADVIWHEYAHAIQFNLVPTWGGGESGALGEGFGDYWAASSSRSLGQWDQSNYHYNWVFNWDGHNPFWAGRILNDTRTYPFAALPIHSAGQIWSAALMGIWNELGRDVTDRLMIKSLMYLGSGATGRDNAHAMIQADRDLYGGAHISTLLYWLGTVKRFIDPATYQASIHHQPSGNTLNTSGPYSIRVSVTSVQGIPSDGVRIQWGWNGQINNTATMEQIGPGEFGFDIPGRGVEGICRYYIVVSDNVGRSVTSPSGAPGTFHQFQAGLDSTLPVIEHAPPQVWSLNKLPVVLSATVLDNTLVDTAWVEVMLNGQSTGSYAPLYRANESRYTGELALSANQLAHGDSLTYRFLARDGSTANNLAVLPADGQFVLRLINTRRAILLVNDDIAPGTIQESPEKGISVMHGADGVTPSCELFHRALAAAGYLSVVVPFADLDTASLATYDAIVLIGGLNITPFNEPAKRSAISRYAAAGGKMFVEGGEVGYYYRAGTDEVDIAFRRTVLHDSAFVGDVLSTNLTAVLPTHALLTTPNQIGNTVLFAEQAGFAGRDAMTLIPGDDFTYHVAGWANSSGAPGIIIHENPGALDAPRSVFFTFAVSSIADTNRAVNLIQNAIEYLLSPKTTLPPPEEQGKPRAFVLNQNFPNPFNPETTIQFMLPEGSRVTLTIHDVLGERIVTLVDRTFPPGSHSIQWTGENSNGMQVGSGIYFYSAVFLAEGSSQVTTLTKKMLMVR